MSDGIHLRQSWSSALSDAQAHLQSLLTSSHSPLWKRLPISVPDGPQVASEESLVVIHRRTGKMGEILRLVHDIPAEDFSINAWKAVIATPEMRKEWDPAVESSQLLEMFDVDIRITKTYFTLGWPANPRDAITISRILTDGTTLLDVSTSLPRSPDEPPYLRPTPPYVRSHVNLFAWCIQHIQSSSTPRVRITCFWQHDLKAVWGIGMSSRTQHLAALMIGAVKAMKKLGRRIPILRGYGFGVGIEHVSFDVARQSLGIDYAIVDEQEGEGTIHEPPKGLEGLHLLKEKRRLERSIELVLPQDPSWDVQLTTRISSSMQASSPWTVNVYRHTDDDNEKGYLILRARHAPPPSALSLIKVKLVIEISGSTAGLLRLNGSPLPIEAFESRDPSTYAPEPLLQGVSGIGDLSFQNLSISQLQHSDAASRTLSMRVPGRSENAQKSIAKLVRRNYVYFASLLQEPEVKWKPLAEARGVAVTQLDSIDPTLVVYRAEAVFVGVGVWDLLSAITTPGAAIYWDKGFDGANLMEDVSELTELWHFKTKAAWPVNARESVLLTTSYRSSESVHVFSFSTDDAQLFPNIPPTDPTIIRTQVDLRGWAIEALSPNTTQITLVEQSDPKGWSNKSSIPQQMIANLSGVGEFVIKCGGPPFVSRLTGAKSYTNRYEHEKGVFRLEYEGDSARRPSSLASDTPSSSQVDLSETISTPTIQTRPYIECELRCDVDTWASNLEIVIDPPPQGISCLRRHRLSGNGGGLWITIEHDADFAMGERIKLIVRRSVSSKDKGSVLVNGAKAKIEVEEIPESEIKILSKRKRVKPVRIPLDQPPVLGAIQRRRAEWAADLESTAEGQAPPVPGIVPLPPSSASKFGKPFGTFLTNAVSQATSSTISAVSSVAKPLSLTEQTVPTGSKLPMQHALDALAYLRTLHNRRSRDGWTLVNDTSGFPVHKKLETEVSRTIPVHKGEKVIEGLSAEDIANVLASYDCRKHWDDRFDSAVILEQYGDDCHTAFIVAKGAFPFQPRGFYISSVLARAGPDTSSPVSTRRSSDVLSPSTRGGSSGVLYLASASFNPESVSAFSPGKYNAAGYAIGRVHIQGWILETLDPYTEENYAIPSTRCTHVASVDFAGAVPVAYNSMINASLPRLVLRLESFLKSNVGLPLLLTPTSGFSIEPNEGPQEGWSFERRNKEQILLSKRHLVTSSRFEATIVIPSQDELNTRPIEITPTPSRILQTQSELPRSPPLPSTPSTPGSEFFSRSPRQETSARAISIGNTSRRPLSSFSNQTDQTIRDFILAELIVDSRLYPHGFELLTSSRSFDKEEPIDLSPKGPNQNLVPIAATVFALPPSLLKSSSSEKSGGRYLIRLSLPTARFQIPTIEDPLTGQLRGAPPRPPWLLYLLENGVVIEISVGPLSEGVPSTIPPVNGGSDKKVPNAYKVIVDGVHVEKIGERRALSLIGKLDEDPVMKMPWLARSNDLIFPKSLSLALGAAKDRLANIEIKKLPGEAKEPLKDSLAPLPDAGIQHKEDNSNELTPTPTTKFTDYFTSYSWWKKPAPAISNVTGGNEVGNSSNILEAPPPAPVATGDQKPTPTPGIIVQIQRPNIPSLILVAIISFLLGSLFRSLLSPTDFVIVKHHQEVSGGHVDTEGWREMTRLFELKYIMGGDDLVLGIVRN